MRRAGSDPIIDRMGDGTDTPPETTVDNRDRMLGLAASADPAGLPVASVAVMAAAALIRSSSSATGSSAWVSPARATGPGITRTCSASQISEWACHSESAR